MEPYIDIDRRSFIDATCQVHWSKPKPMDSEENMLKNVKAIQSVNPSTITWVYRNGCVAICAMTVKVAAVKVWIGSCGYVFSCDGNGCFRS